ncbi:hypothetical protein MTO96_003207 [Rhipicephalus appendiculatus]
MPPAVLSFDSALVHARFLPDWLQQRIISPQCCSLFFPGYLRVGQLRCALCRIPSQSLASSTLSLRVNGCPNGAMRCPASSAPDYSAGYRVVQIDAPSITASRLAFSGTNLSRCCHAAHPSVEEELRGSLAAFTFWSDAVVTDTTATAPNGRC